MEGIGVDPEPKGGQIPTPTIKINLCPHFQQYRI